MDEERLRALIEGGERLDVEFKSDRKQLNDAIIYEEVVALANAKGGVLLIGVEDDGTVSGARPRHGATTDPTKMQVAILNNTVPYIDTRVAVTMLDGDPVLSIEVDPYPEPCATAGGKALRRTMGGDGRPQSQPYYPRDQQIQRMALHMVDYSDRTIEGCSLDDLDPLAFERLRQDVETLHGDRPLLDLGDRELAQALRLVETRHGRLVPNVAGLLLLGKDSALERFLPTHQVHFQVIGEQDEVKVNDLFRSALVHVLREIELRFTARNQEREVSVGMVRVPVPDYSLDGFREAVNNALLHRDYARLEAVYIQWQPDHLLISSPGGFPEGITVENILVHEPRPRNPRLAAAFRRIGLVEQTGRGVDRIYAGQVRYGRPVPDYSRSDATGVRVVLRGGQPSLEFAAFVYEKDRAAEPLRLDEMLLLNALYYERRIDTERAGKLIQKGAPEARIVLERLQERGMVEARGERRGRVYHLSAELYRRFGQVQGYVRTKGFDELQQTQMILNFVDAEGRITRGKAASLCRITDPQAYYLLRKMVSDNVLELAGKGRGAHYVRKRTQ